MAQVASRLSLTSILDEPIDWRYKSFPATDRTVTVGTAGEQNWHALNGDFLFPVMVLKEQALQHNIDLMARYCREHGVSLAPHGKTPVAPQIVQRQLEAGAWGITAATIHQVRVFRAFGVQRILLANQLLEAAAVEWVAAELEQDRDFEFLCLVDSLEGVAALDRALAGIRRPGTSLTPLPRAGARLRGPAEDGAVSAARPLRILLEIGAPGGRSGMRDREMVHAVADAVVSSRYLELAGVEGYEGAIPGETLEERIAAVDRFLKELREQTVELARTGLFDGLEEIVVSAGGSFFFDRVVGQLAPPWTGTAEATTPASGYPAGGVAAAATLPTLPPTVRVVLRSGSYVTHDFDTYERMSPLAGRGAGPDRLRPALELWALVLSRPEPDLAIAGFGKRDAPYDLRLPVPFAARRSGEVRRIEGEVKVTALNDQHAYLRIDEGFDLAVGDLIGLDVAHPCTSFDKWRLMPLVDDAYRVTGAIRTFF